MSGSNGTESLPSRDNPYGYVPTQSVAIIFLALFAISTIAHTGQAIFYKKWFMLPTAALCGTMETIGWGARLWSSINPLAHTAFTIQITTTILAPTPLVAANFIILGRIIGSLGPAYSRLSPKWYAIVFCSADALALFTQGAGGGLAASATGKEGGDPTLGANIALGGIIFQTAMIGVYVVAAIEFYIRYAKDRPVRDVPLNDGTTSRRGYMDVSLLIMTCALAVSTTFIFIRAIYRTIELADGFSGRISTTQVYFNVLDGMMIVLAMYTMNFTHPGLFLTNSNGQDYRHTDVAMKRRRRDTESTRAFA